MVSVFFVQPDGCCEIPILEHLGHTAEVENDQSLLSVEHYNVRYVGVIVILSAFQVPRQLHHLKQYGRLLKRGCDALSVVLPPH